MTRSSLRRDEEIEQREQLSVNNGERKQAESIWGTMSSPSWRDFFEGAKVWLKWCMPLTQKKARRGRMRRGGWQGLKTLRSALPSRETAF
jgi:hypothetical protein